MRQQTITSHRLDVRREPRLSFLRASEEFLHPAQKLAFEGQIQAAMWLACDLWIAQHGDMHGREIPRGEQD